MGVAHAGRTPWSEVGTDGTVTVFTGKVELGGGVTTGLAQIVAEELDVPLNRVSMVMGDTARTPDQGLTAGSQTIAGAGPTLRQVAADARGRCSIRSPVTSRSSTARRISAPSP